MQKLVMRKFNVQNFEIRGSPAEESSDYGRFDSISASLSNLNMLLDQNARGQNGRVYYFRVMSRTHPVGFIDRCDMSIQVGAENDHSTVEQTGSHHSQRSTKSSRDSSVH